ncbi:MAG: hypothetical protein AAF466_03205 [Bacteroidota bacterium]
MNSVTSELIGALIQNERFEDWWESEPVEIPLFDNKKLKITFMDFLPEHDLNFIKEADLALQHFLDKSKTDRTILSDWAYKNCLEVLHEVGRNDSNEHLWEFTDRNDIWNYIHPQAIMVSRRHRRDEDIYVIVACECQWEEEHGLQWVFRRGKKLTRISGQDGHLTDADAYDTTDEEDLLLRHFESEELISPELPSYAEVEENVPVNERPAIKKKSWWKRLWS